MDPGYTPDPDMGCWQLIENIYMHAIQLMILMRRTTPAAAAAAVCTWRLKSFLCVIPSNE
jgi:hypothetical protein